MTLTEAKQYESQGWPHKHDFEDRQPIRTINYNPLIPPIEILRCRCGATKIKRGDFEHVRQ